MVKRNLWPFLFIIVWSNCTRKKESESDCQMLNSHGVQLITKFQLGRNDTRLLDTAIQYLDSSIECNPENFLPYSNKLAALFLKKDFSEAIDVLNSMSELSSKNPAKYDDMKAMAYEQLLQTDSANKYYSSALIYHKSHLKQFPDSAALNLSVSLMLLKVKGREAAIIQMSDFGKAHPDDPVVKMYEDAFMDVINNTETTSYDMLINVTR